MFLWWIFRGNPGWQECDGEEEKWEEEKEIESIREQASEQLKAGAPAT